MAHKLIKKILVCKPLHFADLNYTINPWMKPGTINEDKAMHQWNKLIDAYKKMDIKVDILDQQPNAPDMVFATDQAIVQDKTALMSRFFHPQRRGEEKYYEQWFREHGYTVRHLPQNVYSEGNGDTFFWHDLLFIGVGYRANRATCKALSTIFKREVIPLHIVDPTFYHLDVAFFPLNDETAFYYPKAFSEESQAILKKKILNLIEFTKEEVQGFCANSVVTDHHVVLQKDNPTFEKKLHNLGYKTVEVDLSEFKKSGGGAHCLTNVLEEK